jgi:DNA topoisomerase-2
MEVTDFKRYTDIEHVLERPVTYLGPVGLVTAKVWSIDPATDKAVFRDTVYQPPLEQLTLETGTNSVDNVARTHKKNEENARKNEENAKLNAERAKQSLVTKVPYIPIPMIPAIDVGKIEWLVTETEVSMYNEGLGIPVAMHPDTGVHVPELIFFHLRSSSNYNDAEARTWAGSNGLGVKLVAIWSVRSRIEITDPIRKLRYTQECENNMRTIHPPVITPYDGKTSSTRVTYTPDFARFQMEKFSPEMITMMAWQAASAAFTTQVPFTFNGVAQNYGDITRYAALYCPEDNNNFLTYEDDCVKLCLLDTPERGFQVSFVNGMYTKRGGSHVNETLKVFSAGPLEKLNKKQKLFDVRDVKKHLSLVISCKVINPVFKTQSKEEFSHPVPKILIPDKTVKKVEKWDFVKQLAAYADIKSRGEDKPEKKRKEKKIVDIPKMEQANLINTDAPCILILTEGDSAKTFALRYRAAKKVRLMVNGVMREYDGSDIYSIYPLRGKGLNIRNATAIQLRDNPELQAVRQMLNVFPGTNYATDENFASLSHKGGVLYATDADVDGDHITGLGLNLFGFSYKSLADRNYIMGLLTPLLSVSRGPVTRWFPNKEEFDAWLQQQPADCIILDEKKKRADQWLATYFKGLGRWEAEMFEDPEAVMQFKEVIYHFDPASYERLKLAFDKSLADLRKDWVSVANIPSPTYTPNDEGRLIQRVDNFIDTRLRRFSVEDNLRSIPCVVDNLKPSQRKIIYAIIKDKLGDTPEKIAQFMGLVAKMGGYEHGEANLGETIMRMCQDHPGSNNLPLIKGKGNYGTRVKNGGDFSDPRYVYMARAMMLDKVFRKEDAVLLEQLLADGKPVEPRFYIPVVPLCAINGADGIGTGFSTSVPTYHPSAAVTPWVRSWIRNHYPYEGEEPVDYPVMIPHYNGFKGRVWEERPGKFLTEGVTVTTGNSTRITEIPIGMSLEEMSGKIDQWYKDKKITDFKKSMKPEVCDFTIVGFQNPTLKNLGLITSVSTSNITFFNEEGYIVKYGNIESAMDDFCHYRYKAYERRKGAQLAEISEEVKLEELKIAFIKEVLAKTVVVDAPDAEEVMLAKGYPTKFLDMSIRSITPAGLLRHEKTLQKLLETAGTLEATQVRTIWESELGEFDTAYNRSVKPKAKIKIKL